MQRDSLRRSFKRLGIQANDYKVLKLLPLIARATHVDHGQSWPKLLKELN